MIWFSDSSATQERKSGARGRWGMAIAAATPVLAAVAVIAQGAGGVYAKTARLVLKACGAEARVDLLIAGAIFSNLTDRGER